MRINSCCCILNMIIEIKRIDGSIAISQAIEIVIVSAMYNAHTPANSRHAE